jgi:1,4-dihydroxy-2-naphthoate octaprenyltransferase
MEGTDLIARLHEYHAYLQGRRNDRIKLIAALGDELGTDYYKGMLAGYTVALVVLEQQIPEVLGMLNKS